MRRHRPKLNQVAGVLWMSAFCCFLQGGALGHIFDPSHVGSIDLHWNLPRVQQVHSGKLVPIQGNATLHTRKSRQLEELQQQELKLRKFRNALEETEAAYQTVIERNGEELPKPHINVTIDAHGEQFRTYTVKLKDSSGEKDINDFEISGEQSWAQITPDSAGSATLQIDASSLPSGVYKGRIAFMDVGENVIKGLFRITVHRKAPRPYLLPGSISQVVSPGRDSTFSVILVNVGDDSIQGNLTLVDIDDAIMDLVSIDKDLSSKGFLDGSGTSESPFQHVQNEHNATLVSLGPGMFAEVVYDLQFRSLPRASYRASIHVHTTSPLSEAAFLESSVVLDVSTVQVCPASIDTSIIAGSLRDFQNLPFTLINLDTSETVHLQRNDTKFWLDYSSLRLLPERLFPAIPTSGSASTRYTLDRFPIPGDYQDRIVFDAEIAGQSSEQRTIDVNIAAVAGVPSARQSVIESERGRSFPMNSRVPLNITLKDSMGNLVSESSLRESGIDGLEFLSVEARFGDYVKNITAINYDGEATAYVEIDPEIETSRFEIIVKVSGEEIRGSPLDYVITEPVCTGRNQVPNVGAARFEAACLCKEGYIATNTGDCRACPAGTTSSGGTTMQCRPCPSGQHAFAASKDCHTCPDEGAVCTEGILRFVPGYWLEDDVSLREVDRNTKFHQCPRPDACKVENHTFVCATGHTGPLCGVCADGYEAQGVVCTKCTDGVTYFAVVSSFMFILLALLVMRTKEFADNEAAGIFRVFISWSQVTALIGTLSINSSAAVRNSLSLGHIVSGFSMDFQPLRCIFSFNLFERTYAYLLLPIVVITLVTVIGWVAYIAKSDFPRAGCSALLFPCSLKYQKKVRSAVREAKKQNTVSHDPAVAQLRLWQYIVREIKGSVSVVLYLVYFPILMGLVAVWDVYEESIKGETHLNQDLQLTTGDEQYPGVATLAAAGLIAYAFVLPFVALRAIWRHRFSLTSPRLRVAWGFLYEGCRLTDARFLWEFFVLMRKFSSVVLVVLLNEPLLQASCVFYLLVLSIVLHLAVKPYKSLLMESLEALGLGIQALTVLALIAVSSTESADDNTLLTNEQAEEGAAAAIIFANTAVVITMLVAFFFAFSIKMKAYLSERIENLNRWCCHTVASRLCRQQYRKYLRQQKKKKQQLKAGDFADNQDYVSNPLSYTAAESDVESKAIAREAKAQTGATGSDVSTAGEDQKRAQLSKARNPASANPLHQYAKRTAVKRGAKPLKTSNSAK